MPNKLQPEIKEEWIQNTKNDMKLQALNMLELRINKIETEIKKILPLYKIPNNLKNKTLKSINIKINNWDGVNMKSSVLRKEKNERKTKPKKKNNEIWYKSIGKNWFNQRVSKDDFFGKFWIDICQSIKNYCNDNNILFYKSIHKLFNAQLGFGNQTKSQPLLQASIIKQNRKLGEFLKNNNIADINKIKELYLKRHPKQITAKIIREEVIDLLKKKILNPNLNTLNINRLKCDNIINDNNNNNNNNNYGPTHSMPYNNISLNFRYNPLDNQYNNRYPIIDDYNFGYNNNNDNNNEIQRLKMENDKLRKIITQLRMEKSKLTEKCKFMSNKLNNERNILPFSISLDNYNDNFTDILPDTIDDNQLLNNYNNNDSLPIIGTLKDNQSVSTNSSANDLRNGDIYSNIGLTLPQLPKNPNNNSPYFDVGGFN